MPKPRQAAGFEWSYRDLLYAILVVFMALGVLALAARPTPQHVQTNAQGDLVFSLYWTPGSPVDLDLWVQAPGDRPVGWNRPSGRFCNLVRDDLGSVIDSRESRAEEQIICRGRPAGPWTVDVMVFSLHGGVLPVQAQVQVVEVAGGFAGQSQKILSRQATGRYVGEQVTVWQFRLDSAGRLDQHSVNDLPRPLFTSSAE